MAEAGQGRALGAVAEAGVVPLVEGLAGEHLRMPQAAACVTMLPASVQHHQHHDASTHL